MKYPTLLAALPLLLACGLLGCDDGSGTTPLDRDARLRDAEPDGPPDVDLGPDLGPSDGQVPFADVDPVDPSPGCAPLDMAEVLEPPLFVDRGPCPDGHAVRLDTPVGISVTARLLPLGDEGLDKATVVELWWPDDSRWIRADRESLDSSIELRWVSPSGGAALRVVGPRAWRLTVEIEAEETRPLVIDGEISTAYLPVTEDGLAEPGLHPAFGARFDLIDARGRVLDVTRSDGREPGDRYGFRLNAQAPTGPAVVRIAADAEVGGIPIRVGPDGELPWAEPLWEGDDDSAQLEITLTADSPVAGAWFITRTAADALETLDPWLPDAHGAAPPVRIRWRPGFSEPCGSCFRPDPSPLIDIGGRLADPDQWDRAVITHELGHYAAAVFSRDDSPGGPHDGSPVDPAIAWSEGLATFIASWVVDDPLQLDYKLAGVARLDLEAMQQPEAFGTADGTATGDVSERLVAAVLWDMHDRNPGVEEQGVIEPEGVTLDDTRLFGPLFRTLPGRWPDQGAPGIDLLDYLGAVWCDGAVEGLRQLLDARDLPHPLRCFQKRRSPLKSRALGDGRVELWSTLGGTLRVGQTVRSLQPGERVILRPAADVPGAQLDYAGGRAVVGFVEPQAPALPLVRRAGAWELQR